MAQEMVDKIEIALHPRSNLLLQALGTQDKVEVDLFEWELQPEDKLILCSDGLWKAFPDSIELGQWLGLATRPIELCQRLITEANQRDGSDNISVIVVKVDNLLDGEESSFSKINPETHQQPKFSTPENDTWLLDVF